MRTNRTEYLFSVNTHTPPTMAVGSGEEFTIEVRGAFDDTVRLEASAGLWQAVGMTLSPNPYRGFRFPPAVIEHAVWLYHCFSLSLRDVG